MVTSCGVGARALAALAGASIEIVLITTSDLDISLLIRQQDEDARDFGSLGICFLRFICFVHKILRSAASAA